MKLTRPCCPPATRPSAASYKRHRATHTVPCPQSLADAAAYKTQYNARRAAQASA